MKLKKLPESIGDLRSLVHLDISGSSSLQELPNSIGDLTSLISLDLSQCCLIEELPSSITRLVKLQRLSLSNCRKIVKLPDELGNLESLVELNLWDSGVAALPDSVGDLARLEVMNLRGTPVRTLPETVAQLFLLQTLDLLKCRHIERLPELSTSLTDLKLRVYPLRQAPDLSKLIRLTGLTLDDALFPSIYWPIGDCSQLPFKIDEIGKLPRLAVLKLEFESLTSLPAEFNALTQIKSLTLGCQILKCVIPQFSSSLQHLELRRVESETKLPCLSNLNNLSELDFDECWMEGGIFRSLGVDRLESLTRLRVERCGKIPDLSQLKFLQVLEVMHCFDLVEIPGLGMSVSLKELQIFGCASLKRLEIKNLTRLTRIEIRYCKNLRRIEGLEELHVSFVRILGCKCKCKDTLITRQA